MARPEDMRKSFKRNMNRLRLSDSIDLIKYTFTILLGLVGVVIIVAFVFGKPLKSKQVVAQPPRVLILFSYFYLNFIFLVYHICTPTILSYVCFNLNTFEILVDFISCYRKVKQ
jgi:hypothetical protein